MVFRHAFIFSGLVAVIVMSLATIQWPYTQWLWLIAGPLLALGTYDLLQSKHTILRIYPVVGHFRYLFESVRRELQQYFVESDLDGALSRNAIMALNRGAKLGNFFHNTGEGGISEWHLKYDGDLVWQVGTGYFGCRDEEGNFDPKLFAREAARLPDFITVDVGCWLWVAYNPAAATRINARLADWAEDWQLARPDRWQ
jgi:hypothetical protein